MHLSTLLALMGFIDFKYVKLERHIFLKTYLPFKRQSYPKL